MYQDREKEREALQQMMSDSIDAARKRSFDKSVQLTLGELILKLEAIQAKNVRENKEQHATVSFDFGTAIPTELDSWRGSYNELALGYKLTGYDSQNGHMDEITLPHLIDELTSAIGKTFEGWKGGDFKMSKNTPVWVANRGNSGDTVIWDVLDRGYKVVLLTCYAEY